MRARKEGSILFISSIRGVESCAYMGMYSASKAALEAMAFDLAVTLAKWNISVSVVQPGPLNTGIELKQGSYFEDKENPYLPYPEVSLESQSAEAAAEAILNKLSSSYLPFRFQTNELAEQTIAKHLKDPTGMQWYYEQRQR
jgi:retinol dehydrogenase-8